MPPLLGCAGYGMSYQGVPLVVSPVTKTLVLSGDPACTTPGGDKLTFPPATMGERQMIPAVVAPAGLQLLGLQRSQSMADRWVVCRLDSIPQPIHCSASHRVAAPPPRAAPIDLTSSGVYSISLGERQPATWLARACIGLPLQSCCSPARCWARRPPRMYLDALCR